MNKYVLIEKGSRGFIEGVEVVDSKLEYEDFCNKLYEDKVNSMKKGLDKEELEELNEYLLEFGGVGDVYDGYIEVGFSEEEWIEVFKVEGLYGGVV